MKLAAEALISALESTQTKGERAPASRDAQAASPTADGLKLLRAFLNIRDATLRHSVVRLVELLAAHPAKS
jgi:hypothetical protein